MLFRSVRKPRKLNAIKIFLRVISESSKQGHVITMIRTGRLSILRAPVPDTAFIVYEPGSSFQEKPEREAEVPAIRPFTHHSMVPGPSMPFGSALSPITWYSFRRTGSILKMPPSRGKMILRTGSRRDEIPDSEMVVRSRPAPAPWEVQQTSRGSVPETKI